MGVGAFFKSLVDEAKEAQAQRRALIEASRPLPPPRVEPECTKELWQRVDERWPPNMFPRIPAAVWRDHQSRYPDGDFSNLREDWPEQWERMLERWPKPPQSEDESRARAERFWHHHAGLLSRKSDNSHWMLLPKQDIIEFFWNGQKWILREYFAATGDHKKSYFDQKFVEFITWEPELLSDAMKRLRNNPESRAKMPLFVTKGYQDGVKIGLDTLNREARAKREAYWESMDNEKERLGNWYFANVFEANQQMAGGAVRREVAPSDEI